MIRLGSRALQLSAVMALVACAGKTGVSSDALLEAMPGCPGRVAVPDGTTWQEVQGDGFTLCLPADWRPGGRNTWEGDGGRITWGDGGEKRPFAVATVPGEGRGEGWEATERIGGKSARLHRGLVGSSYFTGATWQSPRLALFGEAATSSVARRQIEIYRTVRFTTPSSDHRSLPDMTPMQTD